MDKPKTKSPTSAPNVRKIVNAALHSGTIDKSIPLGELVDRFGSDIDQVAGYVLAWDKYVLVVGKEDFSPEITFRRQ